MVAFYIENRKVSDIAKSLRLSEGTVKSKLFRSRKILKEGMNMSREFGSKSYKPEHVCFAASGDQPSGLPWSAVQRKIPKNILLEASNNPSTLEELSIELGIALPYMEEEVGILKDATLLKQVGNKYVTNFFIEDKECRHAIYKALRSHSKERSNLLDKIITDSLPSVRALNIAHSGISDGELKWWLLIHTVDMINNSLEGSYNYWSPIKRENGEKWGFIGYEQTELPENLMMGQNGSGNGVNMFLAYKIGDYDLWNRVGEMSASQTLLLSDMLRKDRKPSDLSYTEISVWEEINGRYAHTDSEGNVIPDIIVLQGDTLYQIDRLLKAHPLFESTKNNSRTLSMN